MTEPVMAITEAMADPDLFRPWFKRSESWVAWRAFLKALFALPMLADELALYQRCTERAAPPEERCTEAWLVVGRRGGKSLILALLGTFMAAFVDWSPYLVPGETAVVTILATNRRQARAIYRYLRAMFTRVPMLAALVQSMTDEEIELSTGISIEIATASFRTIRGVTVVAALCDEIAFWRGEESTNPDYEILAALRPAMATIPAPLLLCASSPYAKRGTLWDAHRRYFGKTGQVLVWQADTQTMNPSLPRRIIDDAFERDDVAAASEYGRDGVIQFRSDLASYVSREVIDAVVAPDRYELPPMDGTQYAAFVDPSGGSADSMTLAIAHRDDKGVGVLDAIREVRPPFSPDAVTEDFSLLCKSYGVHTVVGDRYGGEWPRERFSAHGISYELSEKPKSDIYRDFLPLLNGGRVELLDLPRLSGQLANLERRVARSGRDSIDHPPGAHDDVANVAAGVLTRVAGLLDGVALMAKLGAM